MSEGQREGVTIPLLPLSSPLTSSEKVRELLNSPETDSSEDTLLLVCPPAPYISEEGRKQGVLHSSAVSKQPRLWNVPSSFSFQCPARAALDTLDILSEGL